jgi:hypothetical protein
MQPHSTPLETTRVVDQIIIDAARSGAAIRAANSLLGDGYVVTSIQTETRFVPVIWVAFDMRLPAMVVHDDACYYKSGIDDEGRYRIGQFRRMGCVVQWRERPGTASWRH